MVLEAVYEEDFSPSSYGFRPKRSAHQALQVLRDGLMEMRGGFVLELDIQKFYDTLNHGHLRRILDQRIQDGVIRRMIDKWLKAGILEEGQLRQLQRERRRAESYHQFYQISTFAKYWINGLNCQ